MKGIALPPSLSLPPFRHARREVYAKNLTFYVDGETPSLNIRIKFRASTEQGITADLEEFFFVSCIFSLARNQVVKFVAYCSSIAPLVVCTGDMS